MPFYALAMRGAMDEIDACILHSISHLLGAMLALGSATCKTKNSMLVKPINTRVVHAIIAHRGGHYA